MGIFNYSLKKLAYVSRGFRLSQTEIEKIRSDLEATAKWCLSRFDPGNVQDSLRSKELNPEISEDNNLFPHYLDKVKIINQICAKRENIFSSSNENSSISKHQALKGGRILAVYPESGWGDGNSQTMSSNFLDEVALPPWDTWFYFSLLDLDRHYINGNVRTSNPGEQPCLYAWIPKDAVPLVDEGIEHCIEEYIIWSDYMEKLLGIR